MMFRLNPFYPPIEWTREKAEARGVEDTSLQCVVCKHEVRFLDVYEMQRFIKPVLLSDGTEWKGWRDNPTVCPVCQ